MLASNKLIIVCSSIFLVFCEQAAFPENNYQPLQTKGRPCCWHKSEIPRDTFPLYPRDLDKDSSLSNYSRWMWVHIARNWRPSRCRSGIVARIRLGSKGELLEYEVTKSCKIKELNSDASKAIKLAAPFDSFPSVWKVKDKWFVVKFDELEYFPPSLDLRKDVPRKIYGEK